MARPRTKLNQFAYKPDEVATFIITSQEFLLDDAPADIRKIKSLIATRGGEAKEFDLKQYPSDEDDSVFYYITKKIKRRENESKRFFHDRVTEEKRIWNDLQIETVVTLKYPFHFHKKPADYRNAGYYFGRIMSTAVSGAGMGVGIAALIGIPFGPLGIIGGIIAGAIIGFFVGLAVGMFVASDDIPAQYHVDREKALDKHNETIESLTKKLNKKSQRKAFQTNHALQPFLGDGQNNEYLTEEKEENERHFSRDDDLPSPTRTEILKANGVEGENRETPSLTF